MRHKTNIICLLGLCISLGTTLFTPHQLHAQTAEKRTIEYHRKSIPTQGYAMTYAHDLPWVEKNLYLFLKSFAQVHLKSNHWVVEIHRESTIVSYGLQTTQQDDSTLIYIGLLLHDVLPVYHDQYIEDAILLLQGFELATKKQVLQTALAKNESALLDTSKALSRWQKHHNVAQSSAVTLEKELLYLHGERKTLLQKIANLYTQKK